MFDKTPRSQTAICPSGSGSTRLAGNQRGIEMIVVSERQSEGDGITVSPISSETEARVVSCPAPHGENKTEDSVVKRNPPSGLSSLSVGFFLCHLLISFSPAEPFRGPIFSFIILPVLTLP